MADPVAERLLASRIELLDLSFRNPLLNHRPSARRGVEIVDEASTQVFQALVVDGLPLKFHPTKESGPKIDVGGGAVVEIQDEEPAAGTVGLGQENAPNSLATPYTRDGLDRRLLETHYDAWLSLEEQGANTLFLALGMLRWRENDEAKQDRLAPLVLVPVRLDRKSARSFWQLTAADEDPGANLSLAEKLKESAVRIDAEPKLETAEELGKYFEDVAQAVSGKPGWAVERDRMVLGFFSFGKFLMYRDLDPAAWPAERAPSAHETMSALLLDGFRERGSAVEPGRSLDELRPPGQVMEVVDCDGSQAEALAEVAAGRPLVIQGPPGTGKSQTITNLVAEAVWSGKRVLFVAEKMAALEVVKRRLENVGLGELCLELHSHKSSKKAVAAEIARTLGCGRPVAPAAVGGEALPVVRDRLNRYARAVSDPVGKTGVSPFRALGILERLRALGGLPAISPAPMADWAESDFDQARTLTADLAAKVAEIGTPSAHPFDGSALAQLLPGDAEKIAAALADAQKAAMAVVEAAAALGRAFGKEPAKDAAGLLAWMIAGTVALEAPELAGVPPVGAAWDRPEALKALDELLDRAKAREGLTAKSGARLIGAAWTADVLAARSDLVSCGGSWLSRLFSGRYKAARRTVQGLCVPPPPAAPDELVALADAILEARRLEGELRERAASVRPLIGEAPATSALRDWALRFRAAAKAIPADLAGWVVGPWDRAALRTALAGAKTALEAWRAAWDVVGERLAFPAETRPQLAGWAFASGLAQAGRWASSLGLLPAWTGYVRARLDVERKGLKELSERLHGGERAPAEAILESAWARGIVDRAWRERPELKGFDAVAHQGAQARFREADTRVFAMNRAKLAELHWKSLPGGIGYGGVGLLRKESLKKARHLPIRRLMEQAGAALQSVKPVFLMSPMSIAQFLPPGGPTFDLVVFDEASQVKPVDAFGAILRGRQLVVVGDEKQMPPTSFFDTHLTSEGPRAEDEETNVVQDVQSILGLCASKGMPSRMLRWHYRSRHDSLIALSNREFYDGKLVVFPSPVRTAEGEGLAYRHLPDTAYDRGTTRSNPKEAEAVAQAVHDHFKARPRLSLGVVAFSQAQREVIEDLLEARFRKEPDFDAWANAPSDEPFFVKNLENVQGDERDVMLISVGYGRDAQGQVTMNFGPLNQGGGERRLNVLITRARRQCVVFTNLLPDDIDLKRAPGEGVKALRAFLAYARSGRLEAAASGEGEVSDFEKRLAADLEGLGCKVERSVGSGGYRVGLAVADPATPGRYVLGIECDGEGYQQARWARDRDRLRETVLKGLGWTLHRAWSADWAINREAALKKVLDAAERAKAGKGGPEAAGGIPKPAREAHVGPPGRDPAPAYKAVKATANIGEKHLADVDPGKLAEFVLAIVDRESPIHLEELRRRVLEAIDARPGQKRLAAIDEAAAIAERGGRIRRKGDFLWAAKDHVVAARDRSELSDASRGLDMICDEECEAALLRAVEEAHGCDRDEAAAQAIRILGAKRGADAAARLEVLIERLVSSGALLSFPGGQLRVKA
jgi:very-short-patch-repair endonuclease